MDVSQNNRMGTLPIKKLLVTMSLPMILSMLVQALYNVVDSVFVSQLGQDALNAVSLAFPVQQFLVAFAVGTGIGMNSLVSRALGQKDQETVNRTANTAAFLYIAIAVIFCVLGLTCSRAFYVFQTDNEQIISYGIDYLSICVGCCFGVYGQMFTERLLQSTSRTDLAMIPQICGAVCNMVLDPILIFGLLGFPRLEVKGAAIATVIGQFLAFAVGLYLNLKKNWEVQLKLSLIRPHGQTIAEIYKIGFPSVIMHGVGSIMNFALNNILLGFTEAATAVYGVAFKLQSFIFLPVFGINGAIIPVVAYNYGSKTYDRVREAAKTGVTMAVLIMALGTLVFELAPHLLLGVFSPSEEMIQIGIPAFRIIGILFPMAGLSMITSSVCQALGRPLYALTVSMLRQLVALLPIAYLMSKTGNLLLVWLAFPISELFAMFLSIYFLKKVLDEVLV